MLMKSWHQKYSYENIWWRNIYDNITGNNGLTKDSSYDSLIQSSQVKQVRDKKITMIIELTKLWVNLAR